MSSCTYIYITSLLAIRISYILDPQPNALNVNVYVREQFSAVIFYSFGTPAPLLQKRKKKNEEIKRIELRIMYFLMNDILDYLRYWHVKNIFITFAVADAHSSCFGLHMVAPVQVRRSRGYQVRFDLRERASTSRRVRCRKIECSAEYLIRGQTGTFFEVWCPLYTTG